MAELCVLSALKSLASAAASPAFSYLGQQVANLLGVEDKMKRIENSLESIQYVLRFADQKAVEDPSVKGWINKVRDVSYMVEDVLDSHIYGTSDSGDRCVVSDFIRRLAAYRKTAVELDRIQPYVEDVLSVYKKLIARAILPSHQGSLPFQAPEHHHRSSSNNKFREDDAFFSMNKGGMTQKEIVERWIVEEPHKLENIPAENMDLRWMVIAVWGMGGLGKTTLVHEIFYRNSALRKQFDCFAWVTVSKTYKIMDLLRSMLKELEECGIREGHVFKKNEKNLRNVDAMNEEQLICRIHQILRQKRYLVVFDDIWNDDFWTGIKHVFRKGHDRRSRILVTTRDEKVALSVAVKDRIMMLAPLEKEEAWRLFCAKAFWQEPEQKCPRELEDWARRIVDKCGGIPLAIVAAAGMMSTKDRDPFIWRKSCETVSLELAETPELSILRHSYYDLPPRLKQCFLYCSIFPEDYEIGKNTLIRLWVAEGFVEEMSSKTLEEVAECYLTQLIERSMIQVVGRFGIKMDRCRIHDIFRVIMLDLSSEQIFSVTVDEEQNVKGAHRLSIQRNMQEINLPFLRSLFYFNLEGKLSLFNCKLMKVLHLENCPITNIPGVIFDLFNLRYLSLRNSKIQEYVFPERIERLQHLQTLDLPGTNVKQLPRNVVKLQGLRHLILSDDVVGAPVGIWKLKNLQTLGTVEATEDLVEHIGQLTNLRTFLISKVKRTHEEALQNSLKRLPHLETLVMYVHEGDWIDLVYLDPPPPHLHVFELTGQLAYIPMWFTSFSNLSELYLNNSRLKEEDDILKYLRSLPRLAILSLSNSYDGTSLSFPTNCFPKLGALYILDLPNLKSISIGKSAMPVLCTLIIGRCPSLAKPVPQVENLVKLEELHLGVLTAEVVQDFQEICSHCSHVKLYLYE